jgi:hypothetical protein
VRLQIAMNVAEDRFDLRQRHSEFHWYAS